jgi:hypothetical protein
VPADFPTRWPASVTPSQALGYLLARHVPPARLPEALTLVREAAGWLPPIGIQSADLGMHRATVRSWMYAARDHARLLGPPPGLAELLAVLGDGVIRTAARARAALEAAGAEELADPRILADFASWCNADVAFEVLPPALRRTAKAEFVVPDAATLTRARRIVSTVIRRYGLSTVNTVLDRLTEEGIQIDAGNDAQALRDLLGTGGYSAWLWPRRDISTPLTTAMTRLGALGIRIPVEQIPVAVARSSQKRWPRVPGEWPPPVEAIRAWVNAREDWRLTGNDEVEPIGPLPEIHPHDRLILDILAGSQLHWTDLHQALKDAGLTSPTAGAAIYKSPLLRRRGRNGYFLVGERDPVRVAGRLTTDDDPPVRSVRSERDALQRKDSGGFVSTQRQADP